jgi:beta-lactamase class C
MRYVTGALVAALIVAPIAAAGEGLRTDPGWLQPIITRHINTIVPADGAGGVAVAVLIDGRTSYFNYGWAERASKRPITTDSLFALASLRKVFEATLLAQAVRQDELALEDPVATHVTELRQGGDIRKVTVGQLATHTSGLLFPQDHPPWPEWGYSLPEFIGTLNAWKADAGQEPGKQHTYTHAGFVLLQVALERRLGVPIDELIEQRITRPLAMASTTLPRLDDSPRGHLSLEHKGRAVQGYSDDGEPFGVPGDQQGYYYWPGTSQMYSSARDMAAFLAANLGEREVERSLREAMELAQRGVVTISSHNLQGLAWEIVQGEGPTIVEKYGGLYNASAYIGMMPSRKLGVVILANRGNVYPAEIGRSIMLELAR